MSLQQTRKIKDAKDLSTNELIYFRNHAKATFMADGRTVEDAVGNKQDLLESGVTIKTINGESLLGEGNIELSTSDGSSSKYLLGTGLGANVVEGGEELFVRLGTGIVCPQGLLEFNYGSGLIPTIDGYSKIKVNIGKGLTCTESDPIDVKLDGETLDFNEDGAIYVKSGAGSNEISGTELKVTNSDGEGFSIQSEEQRGVRQMKITHYEDSQQLSNPSVYTFPIGSSTIITQSILSDYVGSGLNYKNNKFNIAPGQALGIDSSNNLHVKIGTGLGISSNSIVVTYGDGLFIDKSSMSQPLSINAGKGLTVSRGNPLDVKLDGETLDFNEDGAIYVKNIDSSKYDELEAKYNELLEKHNKLEALVNRVFETIVDPWPLPEEDTTEPEQSEQSEA